MCSCSKTSIQSKPWLPSSISSWRSNDATTSNSTTTTWTCWTPWSSWRPTSASCWTKTVSWRMRLTESSKTMMPSHGRLRTEEAFRRLKGEVMLGSTRTWKSPSDTPRHKRAPRNQSTSRVFARNRTSRASKSMIWTVKTSGSLGAHSSTRRYATCRLKHNNRIDAKRNSKLASNQQMAKNRCSSDSSPGTSVAKIIKTSTWTLAAAT